MIDEAVLAEVGVGAEHRLGFGGEAVVYGIDDQVVVRIPRAPSTNGVAQRRLELLDELGRSAHLVDFVIPSVLDRRWVGDLLVTWEERIDGTDGIVALRDLADDAKVERESMVRSMLNASLQIRRLFVDRPWAGEVMNPEPKRSDSVVEYFVMALGRSLEAAGSDFAQIDAAALVADVGIGEERAFVHFDAFPGNVMVHEGRCTAVFDFGPLCAIADPVLDPLLFAVYFDTTMTPSATDGDRAAARRWLVEHDLDDRFDAAYRFAAGFWAGAVADERLHRWVRQTLL